MSDGDSRQSVAESFISLTSITTCSSPIHVKPETLHLVRVCRGRCRKSSVVHRLSKP